MPTDVRILPLYLSDRSVGVVRIHFTCLSRPILTTADWWREEITIESSFGPWLTALTCTWLRPGPTPAMSPNVSEVSCLRRVEKEEEYCPADF